MIEVRIPHELETRAAQLDDYEDAFHREGMDALDLGDYEGAQDCADDARTCLEWREAITEECCVGDTSDHWPVVWATQLAEAAK